MKWTREILCALVYLKSNRIAHRDVKSKNIFVTRDFNLKLGDFGVFKEFNSENEMTNDRIGTLSHMAPELLMDMSLSEQNIYQCDVFATGLVLWEIAMRK
ncbi:unnamed protein product, partial [Mesorhabditis belari]|uniref:receptor protein serine/threonine kinase n=1 Tax=Mesorhabditis belari TaxID=2138241 RepID=A0AAF3FN42_9BILA